MKAKSIKGSSIGEIKSALSDCLSDGFHPTVAIVFVSIKLDRKTIGEMLDDLGIKVMGATTSGEFKDGYQGDGSAVIMLLELDPVNFKILYEDIGARKLADVANQLTDEGKRTFDKPGFILCGTGLNRKVEFLDAPALIQNMEEGLGPGVNIFGGLAGDDFTFTGTYVFTNSRETDNGIVALVLNEDRISLHGYAMSGWKPLGIKRTITKCKDGWIYAIDDKPAFDMYMKYLGSDQQSGEDQFNILEEVGIYYPFLVEGMSNPVIRTPLYIDKEKNAIKLDYEVPEGTRFWFLLPPDFDIVDNVLSKAREIKSTDDQEAKALLIFSCVGRKNALGPLTNSENEGLCEIWKSPMAGFFSYGEFGTTKGKQEFHSTTCSWVVMKES
jgi:hypothetical protein